MRSARKAQNLPCRRSSTIAFSVTSITFGITIRRVTLALFSFSRVSLNLILHLFIGSNGQVGPHLGFAGCALTGRPTMEIFSLLPLNFHSTNDDAYDALARHLSALRKALGTLGIHTEEVDKRRPADTPTVNPDTSNRQTRSMTLSSRMLLPPNLPEDPTTSSIPPIFPQTATFTPYGGHGRNSFIYEAELAGRRLLFKAKTEGGHRICVKFVRRYGKDVHIWFAKKGLAPKLIAYEELPGGWFMVVMELLDESWVPLADKEDPPEGLKERIHAVISELHQDRMVHGDVRATNVIVKDGGLKFMLVDYDWAGSAGQVRYPRHINKAVGRPDDVEDGQPILCQHDEFMLAAMFR